MASQSSHNNIKNHYTISSTTINLVTPDKSLITAHNIVYCYYYYYSRTHTPVHTSAHSLFGDWRASGSSSSRKRGEQTISIEASLMDCVGRVVTTTLSLYCVYTTTIRSRWQQQQQKESKALNRLDWRDHLMICKLIWASHHLAFIIASWCTTFYRYNTRFYFFEPKRLYDLPVLLLSHIHAVWLILKCVAMRSSVLWYFNDMQNSELALHSFCTNVRVCGLDFGL